MKGIIEAIRKKHNLNMDFSMAIEGAAMAFILAQHNKIKESKIVRSRLKNIDKWIEKIHNEYRLGAKESHSIDNIVHIQCELLDELQKKNKKLLDINNREPLFTQLKKDIHKIFTDYKIQYTNTYGNSSETYTLLQAPYACGHESPNNILH